MPAAFTVARNTKETTMKYQTVAALDLLDRGITPEYGETTSAPTDPAPLYDELWAETCMDEQGREALLHLVREAVQENRP